MVGEERARIEGVFLELGEALIEENNGSFCGRGVRGRRIEVTTTR